MPPLNCGSSLQTILDKIYARLNAIQGGAGGGNCDLAPVLSQLDQIDTYLAGINGNTSGLVTMINGVQSSVNSANQSLGTVTTQLGEIQTAISLLSTTGGATVKAAIIFDQKVQNTNGGAFTAGAWRQRELNTKQDAESIVSVSNNSITIVETGNYLIMASAPGFQVIYHQTRLTRNNAFLAQGTSEYCTGYVQTRSHVSFCGTLTAGDVIRLEHQCGTTYSDGFGVGGQSPFGEEIFAIVGIIKLS